MDQEAGQKNATALDSYPGAGDKVGGEERQSHQEVLTLPPFGDSAIASENDQVRHLQRKGSCYIFIGEQTVTLTLIYLGHSQANSGHSKGQDERHTV